MLKKISNQNSGQSLLLASFFLFLILSFSLILSGNIFQNNRSNLTIYSSENASQLAEAGIDKAIWCLNQTTNNGCGDNYGSSYAGETDVPLGDGKFSTVVTGAGNTRTIISTGTSQDKTVRKIKVTADSSPSESGGSFSYALQVGAGGVTMENSSTVNGSIFSNSNVVCTSNTSSIVTGDVSVSGSANKIEKCKINYDASAHNLVDVNVGRNAYYTVIDSKTTVAGTKFPNSPDPAPTAPPSFDLATWEAYALTGDTIEGDYEPASGSSLGPKKIHGNLLIGNRVNLTITGPIWVTGNITIDQSAILTLDPNFGENGTLIIADNVTDLANYGKIIVNNGVSIQSSNPKAHILLLATNNSLDLTNAAVDINNTAQGAIFMALNGLVRLRNNADVKSIASYALHLDQNAEVHYSESDLINLNFAAGPGGNWQIKKGTWQDLIL